MESFPGCRSAAAFPLPEAGQPFAKNSGSFSILLKPMEKVSCFPPDFLKNSLKNLILLLTWLENCIILQVQTEKEKQEDAKSSLLFPIANLFRDIVKNIVRSKA